MKKERSAKYPWHENYEDAAKNENKYYQGADIWEMTKDEIAPILQMVKDSSPYIQGIAFDGVAIEDLADIDWMRPGEPFVDAAVRSRIEWDRAQVVEFKPKRVGQAWGF